MKQKKLEDVLNENSEGKANDEPLASIEIVFPDDNKEQTNKDLGKDKDD